jgi:dipeptidyl aminopeptidase/acylaminoacyl peptidase
VIATASPAAALLLACGHPGSIPPAVRERVPDAALESVRGEATFYADREDERTASGVPFRRNRMVAPHRADPFGTILRVTNRRNERSVTVRVVDRGPFRDRAEARRTMLDLSTRAAGQLGFLGAGRAPVPVEVLEWGSGPGGSPPPTGVHRLRRGRGGGTLPPTPQPRDSLGMHNHTHLPALLRRSLFALAAAAIVAPLDAQVTPERVTQLQAVSAVTISPDARWVAYGLSQPRAPEEDTLPALRPFAELWVAPVAGGAPRPVVQRPLAASGAAWSPDGSRLGFLHRGQVHVVPAAGGEPRAITDFPTSVSSFRWSPDGASIAFTSPVALDPAVVERRRRGDDVIVSTELDRPVRLWVQPVAGGPARPLTPADRTVRDFEWAPDSRRLAVQITETSDADADQLYRRIFLVTADGAEPTLLAPTEGKLGMMSWSPDGSRLAYLGATRLNDPIAQSLFVVTPGGAPVNLTPGYEGTVTWLGWQDARTLRFVAVESTRTVLHTVPAAGGARRRVAGGGAEIFQSASFSRDGRTFAVPGSTAAHPNEVYVGSARDGRLRRLTSHNPWLADVRLGRQETVRWTARDGWTMEGVLVHPLDAQPGVRAPLAVLPHGGPEGIDLDGWNTRALYPVQVLAGAGYAVFMPNYRGSGGRGVLFSQGDHRDLGGREFDDVLDGIEFLHERGVADRDRVGISGTSYGGYFSAWAGTRHSERFRLAIPFAGISNWMSFFGTTDIPLEMAVVHWDLWPYEHPLLMWERSPLAHIANARTPMIVGTGMVDERVHPEQMIQLHQALRLAGVPSELVLYPREPHGLLERQHQLDYMQRILAAFDRWVKPLTPPALDGAPVLHP